MVLPISRRDGFEAHLATEGGHPTEDSLIMDTANLSRYYEPGLPAKKIIKHKSKLTKAQHQINQNYGVSPRDLASRNGQFVEAQNVPQKAAAVFALCDTSID